MEAINANVPLTLLLLGAIISLVSEFVKRKFPTISPHYVVAAIALAAGAFNAFLLPILPPGFVDNAISAYAYAVAFYELLLKQVVKKIEGV